MSVSTSTTNTTSHPSQAPQTRQISDVLVARLRGSQAEMGAQHGRILLAAGGYEKAAEFYPTLVQRLLHTGDATSVHQRLLSRAGNVLIERGLSSLEKRRPQAFRERTRAFMEVMDKDAGYDKYLFIMDVFQNAVGLAGRFGIGPFERKLAGAAPPACSTLMVWDQASATGELLHARNFDLPGIGVWDLGPEVVLCDPDEGLRYGFVTTRGAETPGITCFNEAGLTLTLHTRFHRNVSFRGRGVVDLGHNIIRRAETLADASRIAREHRVASTWGIAVSSQREQRAIVIETNATQTAVVRPVGSDDFLMATNRYRHPLMVEGQVATGPGWAEHSDGRERRMRQVTESARERGGLSTADLERLLGDHEDATAPGEERAGGSILAHPITVASIVSEPAHHRIRVGAGTVPTSWGPYVTVPWEWDGEVGQVASPELTAESPGTTTLQHGRRFKEGAGAEGYRWFVRAHEIELSTHDDEAQIDALEQAATADPSEPTYRFLAGALSLKRGRFEAALHHFERGLENERAPYRRAQMLLWAQRAAYAAGHSLRGKVIRTELLAMTHTGAAGHQKSARADEKRPYTPRRLRKITVNMALVDVL